jgi:predicted nucleotidyltransferase
MLNEDNRDMLSALSDEKATFKRSTPVDIDGIEVRVPSLTDLIRNKRASGRTKDIADAEALEEILKSCQ